THGTPDRGPRRGVSPSDDVVVFEDEIEKSGVVEIAGGQSAHLNAGRQCGSHSAAQHDDGYSGAGLLGMGRDDGDGRKGGVALEQVQEPDHQNTMKRDARLTSVAIACSEVGMTSAPSVFHPGLVGTADCSMRKGIPSFLRDARYFTMSSPSTRSSV